MTQYVRCSWMSEERPSGKTRLGVLSEDLHDRIRFQLGRGTVPPGTTTRPGRRVCDLRRGLRALLLPPLVHGVTKQSGRFLLVALGEVVREPPVLACHIDGVAVEHDLAPLHPDRSGAHVLDGLRGVIDEKDGSGLLEHGVHRSFRPLGERRVSSGKRFINHEDRRVGGERDGELQARSHARRVGAHGQVDRVPESGELDDLLEDVVRLLRSEPHREGTELHVLGTGQVRDQCRIDAEQHRVRTCQHRPGARRLEAGENPEKRRLARAVPPDDSDELAGASGEGHPSQRRNARPSAFGGTCSPTPFAGLRSDRTTLYRTRRLCATTVNGDSSRRDPSFGIFALNAVRCHRSPPPARRTAVRRA